MKNSAESFKIKIKAENKNFEKNDLKGVARKILTKFHFGLFLYFKFITLVIKPNLF